MSKIYFALLMLLLTGALAAQEAMNNDSVIKLIQAGLSEDIIVSTINSSPGEYDTSIDSLISLKEAGVGEKALAAILAKAGGGSAASTTANIAPAENIAPVVTVSPAPSKPERPRIAILEIPTNEGAQGGSGTAGRSGSRGGAWAWYYDDSLGGDPRQNEIRASNVLRDLFTTEFLDQGAGKVRVMERAQIEVIRGEQAFGQGGEVDVSTAVNVGKLAGVKYMVSGRITRFAQRDGSFRTGWGIGRLVGAATGSRIAGAVAGNLSAGRATFEGRLDMRIIDVETGEIIAAAFEEGSTSNVNIMVAGTGNRVQYDDTMVHQVFEPIVKKLTGKLITRLLNAED